MQGTPPERDWTYEVTDKIESVVGTVRDRTTKPVVQAATIVIYGIIVGILGLTIVVLLVLLVNRILDAYLPDHARGPQGLGGRCHHGCNLFGVRSVTHADGASERRLRLSSDSRGNAHHGRIV